MSSQELEQKLAALQEHFDKLMPGQQADLRRAPWTELDMVPAYYRLQVPPTEQWKRVVHFLAQLKDKAGSEDSLGAALAKAHVHERRLFQLARSEYPNDLDTLRRLLQQQSGASWKALGKTLFYWGKDAKKHILQDYFLAQPQETNK